MVTYADRYILGFFLLVLLHPKFLYAGATVSHNFTLKFDVEVALTCSLESYTSQVDFGEVLKDDLSVESVKRDINMTFSGCNADNSTIYFSGANISDDGTYIKNKEGEDFASGVKVSLMQNGKYVNLNESIEKIAPRQGDEISFQAILEPQNGTKIRSGIINTSVDLNITYR